MNSPDLGFFSHFPFLAAAIAQTDGPILECGAGWGSTPLIHYVSGDRPILTAETDDKWLCLFTSYRNARHSFEKVQGDDHHGKIAEWINFARDKAGHKWGVVFLDQAPGEARVPVASILANSATFVVCHDLEADEPGAGGNYGWRQLDSVFKYKSVIRRIRPWTGIYSNVRRFKIESRDE